MRTGVLFAGDKTEFWCDFLEMSDGVPEPIADGAAFAEHTHKFECHVEFLSHVVGELCWRVRYSQEQYCQRSSQERVEERLLRVVDIRRLTDVGEHADGIFRDVD